MIKPTEVTAPADQVRTLGLMDNLLHNGVISPAEHRALRAALREDLVEAVWAARALERKESRDGKRADHPDYRDEWKP